MVSKTQKFRGSRTHGRGHKRGRGAGMRGGRGNAGLHKHKYSYTVKYMPDHFGRHGFVRHAADIRDQMAINVGDLEDRSDELVAAGKASRDKGALSVDLDALGYDKLLGGGRVRSKLVIKVSQASKKAVEKVEAAGGKVQVSQEAPKK